MQRHLAAVLRNAEASSSRALLATRPCTRPRNSVYFSYGPILIRRHASNLPEPSSRSSPLPMPPSMPREDYASPAMYSISYLGRIIRLIVYGTLGLGGVAFLSFEGLHQYIERFLLSTPSRTSSGTDPYGWQEENQGWTGGAKGGTDSRLGYKARHALRGAWICQEWGAGGSRDSIGRSIHPDFRGMIGAKINTVDRGYELAEEYIDLAISQAKKKGLRFPANISALSSGPPSSTSPAPSAVEADPTAVDLLLLKAGVLERMASGDSLHRAKDLYEQVLASCHAIGDTVKSARLAGKIGDLALRTGEDGMVWYSWGLERVGVSLPAAGLAQTIKQEVQQVVKKGWFGRSPSKSMSASEASAPPSGVASAPQADTQLTPALRRAAISLPVSTEAHLATSGDLERALSVPQADIQLTPALRRVAISLLVSTEAHLATSGDLERALSVQSLASSLIAPPPDLSTPAAALQDDWLKHRSTLLQLHRASVEHALGRSTALETATAASAAADALLPRLKTHPTANPLSTAAGLLQRDGTALAAEAAFIRGILVEKTDAELAVDCFEHAVGLSEADKGAEYNRYWKAYARVKSRLDAERTAEAEKTDEVALRRETA